MYNSEHKKKITMIHDCDPTYSMSCISICFSVYFGKYMTYWKTNVIIVWIIKLIGTVSSFSCSCFQGRKSPSTQYDTFDLCWS